MWLGVADFNTLKYSATLHQVASITREAHCIGYIIRTNDLGSVVRKHIWYQAFFLIFIFAYIANRGETFPKNFRK